MHLFFANKTSKLSNVTPSFIHYSNFGFFFWKLLLPGRVCFPFAVLYFPTFLYAAIFLVNLLKPDTFF